MGSLNQESSVESKNIANISLNKESESDIETEELKNIAKMRVLVEAQDPLAKEVVDDKALRRFLRARDQDVEKATTMFVNYLKWRKTAIPNGFISDEEVKNESEQNKACMQGVDKTGRPLIIIFGGKHYYSKREMSEFKRYVAYCLEMICARLPENHEKFVAIMDLKGWGYSNCDIRAYLAGLEILQNSYPERLGKVYMIHVPYLFMKAWKIVYPFIDKNTREKIVFVDDKDLETKLQDDIDESQLADIYGGKLPLVPIGK